MEQQTVRSRRRRFLALCMALVMTLGLLPMQVLATTDPGYKYDDGLKTFLSGNAVVDGTPIKFGEKIVWYSGYAGSLSYYTVSGDTDIYSVGINGNGVTENGYSPVPVLDKNGIGDEVASNDPVYSQLKDADFVGWAVKNVDTTANSVKLRAAYTPYVVTANVDGVTPGAGVALPTIKAGSAGSLIVVDDKTKVEKYATVTVTAMNPTKQGYAFAYWTSEDVTISNSTSQEASFTMPGKDVTVTAKYAPVEYKINYVIDEAKGTNLPDQWKSYTVESIKPNGYDLLDPAAKPGYVFDKWTEDDANGEVVTSIPVGSTGDKTFYANFKALPQLTWDLNGGKIDVSKAYTPSGGYNPGTSIKVPTVTRAGYDFAGWQPNIPDVIVMGDADATYRAQWAPKDGTYTIMFDLNGSPSNTPKPITAAVNADEPLPTTGFSREGYTFIGWATSKTATEARYVATARNAAKEGEIVTLYAVWTKEALHDIEANLTSIFNAPITLQLWRGDTMLSETTIENLTSASGKYVGSYTFRNNPNGIYNLKAFQVVDKTTYLTKWTGWDDLGANYELTMTAAVIVKNGNVTSNIAMPENPTSSTVEVGDNMPQLVVGGLDELASTFGVNDTDKVKSVSMKVEQPGNVTALENTAKNLVTVGATNASSPVTISISLTKTLLNDTTGELTELPENYYLEIILPVDSDTANDFVICRTHGGNTDQIKKLEGVTSRPIDENGKIKAGKEGWFYDRTQKLLFIYLNKFCDLTYVAFTDPAANNDSDSGRDHSSTAYGVKVLDSEHGAVKADRTTALANATVTLSVTPETGYVLSALSVKDKSGNTVAVKASGSGHTFVMPRADVTVQATFAPASGGSSVANCPRNNLCPMDPFVDLVKTAWYHDGVHYVLANGIMSGYDATHFAPNDAATRAQIAQIFYNMAGKPAADGALNFTDVKNDAWYADAIRWAVAEGIITGYTDGRFGPNDPVTREQLVTIIARYAAYKGVDVTSPLADLSAYEDLGLVQNWALASMRWAVGTGLLTGRTTTTLAPSDKASRVEIAVIIYRYCEKIAK